MNIWEMLIINPMLNTLLWIYSILGNFGIAIILFTIIVRLITHPLTVRQLKSAAAMQDMQKSKKWQDLQKKYKNDKQKLQQEQMKLYQEMGVNPLGSCLPTLNELFVCHLGSSLGRGIAGGRDRRETHFEPRLPAFQSLIC